MNYKLDYKEYKELKDAGFPQPFPDMLRDGESFTNSKGEVFYHPTLSELIEACGERFIALRLNHYFKEEPWIAEGMILFKDEEKGIEINYTNGKFPEEAVAKLYLKLNANRNTDN